MNCQPPLNCSALGPLTSPPPLASRAPQGKRVTAVNMTWPVPAYPTTRGGGNAPGWWWGFEPVPALDLLQPILAYGDGSPDYTIFNGEFDWSDGAW